MGNCCKTNTFSKKEKPLQNVFGKKTVHSLYINQNYRRVNEDYDIDYENILG